MAEFTSILICGGSLAGTACAIRLKQLGHEAIVVDKSRFPRKKLCGEFLGPDAILFLKKLGVWECVEASAYGPVERIEIYSPSGRQLRIHARWIRKELPYGVAIPRDILDAQLCHYARAHGIRVLEKQNVVGCRALDTGGFLVDIETRNPTNQSIHDQILCDILIDALGRNSRLSAVLGKNESSRNKITQPKIAQPKTSPLHKRTQDKKTATPPQKVGLQCHVRHTEENRSADLRMFLFQGGYGGIQPISRHHSNVCMLVDDRLAQHNHLAFEEFLNRSIKQNPVAEKALESVELDGVILSTANLNLDLKAEPLKQLIRIGDALITVDPFTGFGMAHALQTGYLSAECIHEGLSKKWPYARIKADYYTRYQKTFGRHLKWIQYLRPVLESPRLQESLWEVCSPFLPLLASVYR